MRKGALKASLRLTRQHSQTYKPLLTKLPRSDESFEEEYHPKYKPERFCNISPGDLVKDGQYSIVSKLGWGGGSTVWLAQDLHEQTQQQYVAINFGRRMHENDQRQHLERLQRISLSDPSHQGHGLVRQPIDNFDVTNEHGTHLCVVYDPLRMTLHRFRQTLPDGRLPFNLVKVYAWILLHGLDYLHSSCNIIHTDLKLHNVLLTFEHDDILPQAVEQLKRSDHVYKETKSRRIFASRDDFGPLKSQNVIPIIGDFDTAEDAGYYAQIVQPNPYRAPEVILGWGWTEKADIWNFGHLVWAMASGADLFRGLFRENGTYDAAGHLAQMICVLGPPHPELIRRQTHSYHFWSPGISNESGENCTDATSFFGGPFFSTASGEFLQPDILLPEQSLESMVISNQEGGTEDAENFVDFMRQMLAWDPDARLSAKELLEQQWLATCREGIE